MFCFVEADGTLPDLGGLLEGQLAVEPVKPAAVGVADVQAVFRAMCQRDAGRGEVVVREFGLEQAQLFFDAVGFRKGKGVGRLAEVEVLDFLPGGRVDKGAFRKNPGGQDGLPARARFDEAGAGVPVRINAQHVAHAGQHVSGPGGAGQQFRLGVLVAGGAVDPGQGFSAGGGVAAAPGGRPTVRQQQNSTEQNERNRNFLHHWE